MVFSRIQTLTPTFKRSLASRRTAGAAPVASSSFMGFVAATGVRRVHAAARSGFTDANNYDTHRPSYPIEAVRHIVTSTPPSKPNAKRLFVEIGAGTGKFTRAIRDELKSGNASLIAVEPVEEMRKQFTAATPDVPIHSGTAEQLPSSIHDASVDGLICAQAFHWFATPPTLVEFARVLRHGGTLHLVWNERDLKTEWVKAYDEVLASYYPKDVPRQQTKEWNSAFEADAWNAAFGSGDGKSGANPGGIGGAGAGICAANVNKHKDCPFKLPLRMKSFPWNHSVNADSLVALAMSKSVIGRLDDADKKKAAQKVRDCLKAQPAIRERVTAGANFDLPYVAEVFSTTKL